MLNIKVDLAFCYRQSNRRIMLDLKPYRSLWNLFYNGYTTTTLIRNLTLIFAIQGAKIILLMNIDYQVLTIQSLTLNTHKQIVYTRLTAK